MRARKRIIGFTLVALLPVSIVVSSSVGAVRIDPGEFLSIVGSAVGLTDGGGFTKQQEAVLLTIRLPRVLLSVFAGGILAVTGAGMQGLFRNPLADPSIIGISSGAALFAAVTIVFAGGSEMIREAVGVSLLSASTFVGALGTSYLVFRLARRHRETNIASMLLAGIAVNALGAAGTSLLTFLTDDAQLRRLMFWLLGSLGGASWTQALFLGLLAAGATAVLYASHKGFNALSLGESEARTIGTDTEKLKTRVIVVTSLAVGSAVSMTGVIGFIGLVVPHILRLLVSPDYRLLIPMSALGGAVLLCWADTVSRLAVAPAELPVGILTAVAGAPLFLYLLTRNNAAQG